MNNGFEKEPLKILKNLMGEKVLDSETGRDGVGIVFLDRNSLLEVVKLIRDNPDLQLKYLSYMTAVDRCESARAFYVIYEFINHDDDSRIRLRVYVSEKDPWIPTITSLFPSANWHEREMMEMFGIEVRGHPDPRKLLLPDWVDESPLRKSFPHEGEELWKFHEKVIEMFNEKGEYEGKTDDHWLERLFD